MSEGHGAASGARLRLARQARGFSQQQVASMAGVSRQAVSAVSWWPCPSREALQLAAAGLVHVAGTHLRGLDSEYNITPAADLLREGGEVIGFCSWQEGLVLRPGLADGISGLQDLAGSGLRLVNREPSQQPRGAGAHESPLLRLAARSAGKPARI